MVHRCTSTSRVSWIVGKVFHQRSRRRAGLWSLSKIKQYWDDGFEKNKPDYSSTWVNYGSSNKREGKSYQRKNVGKA